MVDTKKVDRKAIVTRESETTYVWRYEDHEYTAIRDLSDEETEEEFLVRQNDIFWSNVRLNESVRLEMEVGDSKTYYEDDGLIE